MASFFNAVMTQNFIWAGVNLIASFKLKTYVDKMHLKDYKIVKRIDLHEMGHLVDIHFLNGDIWHKFDIE